ncbi:AAA family ATPase [Nocardia sp. NPDC004604]|uniref:helix-turn-helix transcriptional regulator n=1 Tax=Nocardia sp. NPDC004604 TaxID=3157013 RepID=UPI0033B1A755
MFSGPLRGRSEPMTRALAVLRGACRHGAGGIVTVCGPPGIGKTAVLSEICRQAARMGMRVASSRCEDIDDSRPGAPVFTLLRSGRDPLLAPAAYDRLLDCAADPLVFVEAVTSELEALAASAPMLIAIDDLHRADRASRSILRELLSRLTGLPIVWVFTTGKDDLGPDLLAYDVSNVERLDLAPLTRADLVAIAQDRLGRIPGERVRGYLDAIGGNPRLGVQLIDNVARAAARNESDTVAVEFSAAVAARLAQLGDTARGMVHMVAVADRPVPIQHLVVLTASTSAQGWSESLTEALESALVHADADMLTCRHDVVRESVYACIPKTRARALHRTLADYYLTEVTDPLHAASHARAAATPGDLTSAAALISTAETLMPTNLDEAGELAALAFRTVGPDQPEWLDLGRRCLAVLCRTQHSAEAIAVADLILARLDDDNLIAEVETQAAQALWLGGRIADLIARTERVLRQRTLLPEAGARLRAASALANTYVAKGSDAIRCSEAALAHARTVDDPKAIALALQAAGEAAKNDARHRTALAYFRELRALGGVSYLAEEITELQFLDRYDHAQALLDQARTDRRTAVEPILPALSCTQMWQDFNLGRLDEADAAAGALTESSRQLGNTNHILDAIMVRVSVALLRGDTDAAAAHMLIAQDISRSDDSTRRPVVGVMSGWVAAARGDFPTALDIWRPVLDGAGECNGYWPLWPCWTGVFFKFGNAALDREFTSATTDVAQIAAIRNPGVASFEGMALNLRGRNAGDLDLIGQAALVLARSPRPLLRAGGAESHGRALLAAGDRIGGLTALDHAWDEFHSMGARAKTTEIQKVMREAGARRAKWSAVPTRAANGWAALTPSERRVAALIGAGHTNKSAAAELGISVNTVGTHLRSAFAKLGIQSRVQLANILHSVPAS